MKPIYFHIAVFLPFFSAAQELNDYTVVNAREIPEPLAAWSGDPDSGALLYETAGCAGCHENETELSLKNVGNRMTRGEIRLMIVEPRIFQPNVQMPAYYTPGVYEESEKEFVGKTRLTAIEIEQLVVWLSERRG